MALPPFDTMASEPDLEAILGEEAIEEPQFAPPTENLAEGMSEEELARVGEKVSKGFDIDDKSMEEWRKSSAEAMDLARMVSKGGDWPFENCSDLVMPTVAQAVIQFAARAYPSIINDNKPVKARVLGGKGRVMQPPAMPPMDPMGAPPMGAPMGEPPMGMPPEMMAGMAGPPEMGMPPMGPPVDPGAPPQAPLPPMPMGAGGPPADPAGIAPPSMQADGGNADEAGKQARADRQADFMSWQLMEEMTEWEADTDRLLHILPAIGSCWRKIWFDPSDGRNKSELVHPTKVVVNNKCGTSDRLPRLSVCFELYPHEIETRFRDKRWRRVVLENVEDQEDDEGPIEFCEQLCRMDLDDDGYDEPVVVTYQKGSNIVVRIANDFYEEDVKRDEEGEIVKIDRCTHYILYTFLPDPEGNLLGMGFGHLLRSLAKAQNAMTNMLIDAGILANAGGGFIRKSARIKPGTVDGKLNTWFVTDIPDGVDPFIPFPRPTPDATLFNMLGMIENTAKEVTATTDLMVGELSKNVQPTTALAMIEQGAKVFNAVYKRIYRALKQEYKALAKLNFYYLNPQTYYEFNDSEGVVGPEDFDPSTLDVAPAADPSMVNDMVEMGRVGALQMFLGDPMIDQIKLRQRMLAAMGITEDMMAPPPPPPQPDPMLLLEQEKVAIERERLALDQQRLQLEAQRDQAELQLKGGELEVKAMAAMQKGGDTIQMPEPESELDRAKAMQLAVQAEIARAKAPHEIEKISADTALALAKARGEGVKARSVAEGDNMARTKMAIDATRGAQQERRADQQMQSDAEFKQKQLQARAPASGKA